jgi:small-conductance mechanosensitive channel
MKSVITSFRVWLATIALALSAGASACLHYLPHFCQTWLPSGLHYATVENISRGFLLLSVYSVIASLINAGTDQLGSRYQKRPVLVRLLALKRGFKIGIFLILANEAGASLDMPTLWAQTLSQVIRVAAFGTLGWCVFQLIQAGESLLIQSLPASPDDNRDARQRYTHIVIIKRILILLLAVMTIAAMLMTFERIRAAGTAILASAGVFSTIVVFSARGLLESIFKGLQLAISQPIRLQDTVTINGENGTVTSITLHHVIVTLSDRSQLIVPTSELLDKTFKNWTHSSDDLIGNVVFYVNYNVSIESLRKKLDEILKASAYWDKGIGEIRISDFKNGSVELKLVVSAKTGKDLSKLRNEILEKLLEYMQKNHPEGLPG